MRVVMALIVILLLLLHPIPSFYFLWMVVNECCMKILTPASSWTRDLTVCPESFYDSYRQRLKDLELISLVQMRLRGQLIEGFKYLNTFNNVSTRRHFNNVLNDGTRNNGKQIIANRFNTSVAQHLFRITIATTWNGLPYDVVNSRTVNTFMNRYRRTLGKQSSRWHVNWQHW